MLATAAILVLISAILAAVAALHFAPMTGPEAVPVQGPQRRKTPRGLPCPGPARSWPRTPST